MYKSIYTFVKIFFLWQVCKQFYKYIFFNSASSHIVFYKLSHFAPNLPACLPTFQSLSEGVNNMRTEQGKAMLLWCKTTRRLPGEGIRVHHQPRTPLDWSITWWYGSLHLAWGWCFRDKMPLQSCKDSSFCLAQERMGSWHWDISTTTCIKCRHKFTLQR